MKNILEEVRDFLDPKPFDLDAEVCSMFFKLLIAYHQASKVRNRERAAQLRYLAIVARPKWDSPNFPMQAREWLAQAKEYLGRSKDYAG